MRNSEGAISPLSDPSVLRCPYPFYRHLRDEQPVYQPPGQFFFLVTRRADVEFVSVHPEIFLNDVREVFFHGLDPRLATIYQTEPALSTADGEPHGKTRKLLADAFGTRRIQEMQPEIQLIVDTLLDRIAPNGRAEMQREFAIPLPVWVIADVLGIAREDLDRFKRWSDAIVVPVNPSASDEEKETAPALIAEHNEYFRKRLEEKRRNPTGDVLSILAVGGRGLPDEQGLERLTEGETLTVIQQLLSAGNETTTSVAGSCLLRLAQDPALQDRLRLHPDLVLPFIDEVLRLESPQQGLWRRVACATELGGVALPAGAILNLRYGSANRDERHYDCPEQLDISRKNTAGHFAFGYGIHTCLGRPLARKELDVAMKSILKRFRNIRLATDRPAPEYFASFIVRGLPELHLEFDLASEAGG